MKQSRAAALIRYVSGLKSIVILVIIVVGGCAGTPPPTTTQPPEPVVTKQNKQAEKRLKLQVKKLTDKTAKLELKLLEKQAEINQLMMSQQNSIREAVRSKAKLRSHHSKAEAVADMIETKMAINAVNADQMNEQQKRIMSQADSLMLMSDKALGEGNIEGASFLSAKARQLILTINMQNNDADPTDKDLEKITFLVPLTMKTTRRSNVRDKPDINSKVQFQLQRGLQVKALWYIDKWIHIEDDMNRNGWVFYQLLELAQ